jgi:hypothetical protein
MGQRNDGSIVDLVNGFSTQLLFSVEIGQTAFPLSAEHNGLVLVSVNGQLQIPGYDYQLTSNQLIWTSPDFYLEPGDSVLVSY